MGRRRQTDPHRLIANFMAAIGPMEKYLKQGRPLTTIQLESMSLAVSMFQTFLNVWKERQRRTKLAQDESSRPWFMNVETKQVLAVSPHREKRNPAAIMLGRLGGLKGGTARARKLSSKRRAAIARVAARARWAKRSR